MKGLIFTYLATAFGVVGGLANPVIGLFVYVLFATLRPQYLWGFTSDFSGIGRSTSPSPCSSAGRTRFRQYGIRRVMYITAPLLFFGLWVFLSAQTAADAENHQRLGHRP